MRTILTLVIALVCSVSYAQPTKVNWQHFLGGSNDDYSPAILRLPGGDIIVAGGSNSIDGDIQLPISDTGYHAWIVRLDAQGAIRWEKSIGGNGIDNVFSVVAAPDGGFVLAGSTTSTLGDARAIHGSMDAWVLKLAGDGSIQWSKCFGGSSDDAARSLLALSTGEYLVAGNSHSTDGQVTGHHGSSATSDIWLFRITANGDLTWQSSFGGSGTDSVCLGRALLQLNGGQFIVAGVSTSSDGDITSNHGDEDGWIFRVNWSGQILWQRSIGGSRADEFSGVLYNSMYELLAFGSTHSTDGDLDGKQQNSSDALAVLLDSNGTIKWVRWHGGSDDDYASAAIQTSDGSYVIVGSTASNDLDVSGNHGDFDAWLFELDPNGALVWQKCYGGEAEDDAYGIAETPTGLVIDVTTASTTGDMSGTHGNYDIWVAELGASSSVSIPSIAPADLLVTSTSIEVRSLAATSEVRVFNILGQLCYSAVALPDGLVRIPRTALASGAYQIVVSDHGSMVQSSRIGIR